MPAEGAETIVEMVAVRVGSVIPGGTVPAAMVGGVIESVRGPGTGAHASRMHATHGMSAANVPGEAAAPHPTTTAMPAAALRPHGYGEHQGKRRDRDQATHTPPL